ncbi:MAG: helix-turn-helix domain-containing protein [Nocardioides sp.]
MTPRPPWAARLRREREARGWSQAQAVGNLRAIYQHANGREGGSQESLTRQWKEWESGRVRPREWARYIAACFGTVADDLFPVEPLGDSALGEVNGMDTAELVARLQRSSIDATTVRAVEHTVERLSGEYRYRPIGELRTESHEWLRRMTRLLGERLTYAQHGEILALAGRLALLVGCIEYDAGDRLAAETTRRYALDLGTELDHREIMGWAHEMSAWFALTSGDYHQTIAVSEHGIEVAGPRGVSVQLHAQIAKAWARLDNSQQVEVALDRGRKTLEDLPRPTNPDDHFAIDAAKWHFYVMDAYRNVGKDSIARLYAEEVLRLGTSGNGDVRSPMRVAEARVTLGVLAARDGDIDGAVTEGRRALDGARQSLPSLVMVGQELSREFQRQGLQGDARVRDFRTQLERTMAVQHVGSQA